MYFFDVLSLPGGLTMKDIGLKNKNDQCGSPAPAEERHGVCDRKNQDESRCPDMADE